MTVLTVFNTADVSLSTKEAQRRRATLSQSAAMHSTLPASVSSLRPALLLSVTPLQNLYFYKTQKFHLLKFTVQIYCMIGPLLVKRSTLDKTPDYVEKSSPFQAYS